MQGHSCAKSLFSRPLRCALLAAVVLGLAAAFTARAQTTDTINVVTGHGVWDSFPTEVAVKAGYFKASDLDVEFLYSSGTGETMQAVISGAADIGEVGTLGTFAAYLKGAPLRMLGAEATGSSEYWYVKADSDIKNASDLAGKSISFSSQGSSTHSVVRGFLAENNIKARPVATGSPASTLTAVMTGQVDVGWASPPFGLKEIDEGKIRIIFRGNDVRAVRGQTIRVIVTNVNALTSKREALQRYMDGRAKAIDLMYSDNPQPIQIFAANNKISDEMARRVREFYPKEMLLPDEIQGLDLLLREAVDLKFLTQPLTKEQIAEVVQLIKPRR